jgi:DNA-binding Lrp family transcriptional regulator
VLEYCFIQPFVSVSLIAEKLGIPTQTVRRYVATLEKSGIIRLSEILMRNERVYENSKLLNILRQI